MREILIPELAGPRPEPVAGAILHRLGGATMGTTWSVVVVAQAADGRLAPGGDVDVALRALLDDVIARMSNWEADSDVGRFNAASAGEWVPLAAAAFDVLRIALDVARDSGGAFDPCAGPLVDLWGFGPAGGRRVPPPAAAVTAARGRCRRDQLELDAQSGRIRQPGGLSLDLCAIAKGHAVDALSRHLDAAGFAHHLVEIGGELRGAGVKPDGTPWWVELETPPPDREAPAAALGAGAIPRSHMLALYGQSVATSGDYRRFFDCDGRRYAHTIDPRTGYPVTHALASVTVVHPDCRLADAWSTALTVLGPEAGMTLASQRRLSARFLARTPHGFVERLTPAYAAMLQ